MKTIKFQEIIECSNQQSIITGQAGFGIRTLTEGMDEKLAQTICEQINCAYEVDITDQVTAEEISQDANVIKKYPRTLRYTTCKDDDGNNKFVIACTTYVGIDYGYFCGQESARRAGTNYIADILVFNEQPTAKLIDALLAQEVFLPVDNTCTPDNPELKTLLTGEPSFLKPREITFEEQPKEKPVINEQTALVAIALIQAKSNQNKGKEKGLQEIVWQSSEDKVASILRDFAILPEELTDGMFFQTNYLQGYGMPKGYHMLFLNERNKEEVYTDNYVYANLTEKTFKNVDAANRCFPQMKEAAKGNDYPQFQALMEICLHKDLSYIEGYLRDTTCEPKTLQAIHDILENHFAGQMEISKNKGILELYQFAKEVGDEIFATLNLTSLINTYAYYCFEHPKKADIECATYFLCGQNPLEEEAETYLEIICRLHKNAQNINGTYWELLIAKRLGLPLKSVRMKIYEKLLQYLKQEKTGLNLDTIKGYMTDSYSDIQLEEQVKESMLMIDYLWKVFESQEGICQECTIAIIETAKWSKKDIKTYVAKCDNKKAQAFIKKHYGFWSSLARKLFKQ